MRDLLQLARYTVALSWRADRKAATVVAAIVVLEAFSAVSFALAQRWVIDTAIAEAATALVAAALIGGCSWAVNAAGNRIVVNLHHDLAEKVDIRLNEDILGITTRLHTLEHLERPEYHDRVSLLTTRTGELSRAELGLARTASAVVSVVLSVIVLSGVHVALGLLVILALPPIWMSMLAQRQRERARQRSAADERRDNRLHRMGIELDSAHQLRVMGAAHLVNEWADAARDRHIRVQVRAAFAATGWELLGWAIYAIGFAVTLIAAVGMVASGAATLGGLVLAATLATRLRSEVRRAVESIKQVAQATNAAAHFVWLREFDRNAAAAEGTAPVARRVGRIELRGVGFRYPGSAEPVLRDVDLVLEAGQTIALVGLNGAGKSTLVKLLTGMYTATEGEVLLDGEPLGGIDAEDWRRRTTGAFQDSMRLRTTVSEAVGLGDLERVGDHSRIREAIEVTGADVFVDRLPKGTETLLDRSMGGHELSGGQWQRLALARAHMRDEPNLQILDEPTAALDPQAEHYVHALYSRRTVKESRTITLLVSHRFSTVRMADLILVLRDGRIVERGSHTELMEAGGRYSELYESQARQYR